MARLWRRDRTEPPDGRPIAIRSRRSGVVHLEDETTDLLDLIPLFHDRALGDGVDWNRDVTPRIVSFAADKLRPGPRYVLYIDAHAAIAFAAGWVLHRSDVTVMQATGGRLLAWQFDQGAVPAGLLWHERREQVGSAGPDVALALSVTHNIFGDVLSYVSNSLPSVGLLIGLTVSAPSHSSVLGGAHAVALAEAAVALAREHRPRDGRSSRVHLFAAAPNGLMFQLGRAGRALGRTTVYEFDFEEQHRGYASATTFPLEDTP